MQDVPHEALAPSLGEPRVIVGLDFGTTFSGFSYALKSDPDKIYSFCEWPGQSEAGDKQYVKTSSSSWYLRDSASGAYLLEQWGWPAIFEHAQAVGVLKQKEKQESPGCRGLTPASTADQSRAYNTGDPATTGILVSKLKLHLADNEVLQCYKSPADQLPEFLSVEGVIADYLAKLASLILEDVQKRFGPHLEMEDIQWALTVPAIWTERAKQRMKIILEMAGLVRSSSGETNRHLDSTNASPLGSIHPLQLILEPEAASIYVQKQMQPKLQLKDGDRFIVVDAGGGTVDLVGHEKAGSGDLCRVREISKSTGGLCGSAYVDEAFFEFLGRKIECFKTYAKDQPESFLALKKIWEDAKCAFGGDGNDTVLELPSSLVSACVQWSCEHDGDHSDDPAAGLDEFGFDDMLLTCEDMKAIFHPAVSQIMALISAQLHVVKNCKAIICVGGFSNSKYLLKCVQEKFGSQVPVILSPEDPGAAVCQGAVLLAQNPGLMLARVSKKTYGIGITRVYVRGDDSKKLFHNENGTLCCKDVFHCFVVNGQAVPKDAAVEKILHPTFADQQELCVEVFCTENKSPRFTTDDEVTKLGRFDFCIPDISGGLERKILMTMHFGRTMIEVKAKALNFGSGGSRAGDPVKFTYAFE